MNSAEQEEAAPIEVALEAKLWLAQYFPEGQFHLDNVAEELALWLEEIRAEEREACAKEVESLRWPEHESDDERDILNRGFTTAAQCIRVRGTAQDQNK